MDEKRTQRIPSKGRVCRLTLSSLWWRGADVFTPPTRRSRSLLVFPSPYNPSLPHSCCPVRPPRAFLCPGLSCPTVVLIRDFNYLQKIITNTSLHRVCVRFFFIFPVYYSRRMAELFFFGFIINSCSGWPTRPLTLGQILIDIDKY